MVRTRGFIFRKMVVCTIMAWYSVFYMHQYKQSCSQTSAFDSIDSIDSIEHTLLTTRLLLLMHVKHTTPYHKCTYNHLP